MRLEPETVGARAQNANHELPCGGFASFYWAVHPSVVSTQLDSLKERACDSSKLHEDEKSLEHRLPDLLVVSTGLWPMHGGKGEQDAGLRAYQRDLDAMANNFSQVRIPCDSPLTPLTCVQNERAARSGRATDQPSFRGAAGVVCAGHYRPQCDAARQPQAACILACRAAGVGEHPSNIARQGNFHHTPTPLRWSECGERALHTPD